MNIYEHTIPDYDDTYFIIQNNLDEYIIPHTVVCCSLKYPFIVLRNYKYDKIINTISKYEAIQHIQKGLQHLCGTINKVTKLLIPIIETESYFVRQDYNKICKMYNVANLYLDELLYLYSNELLETKSIIRIQKQFRESNTNPEYSACKRRLQREFNGLSNMMNNRDNIAKQ